MGADLIIDYVVMLGDEKNQIRNDINEVLE